MAVKASNFQRFKVNKQQHAIISDVSIKSSELLDFTELLRQYMTAGLPLTSTIELIIPTIKKESFQSILKSIAGDIHTGKLLSVALQRFPTAFSSEYCALISAAEESGKWTRTEVNGQIVPGILDMLVDYLRRRDNVLNSVMTKLMYPAVLGIAFIVVILVIAFFILPKLKDFFSIVYPADKQWFVTRALFAVCEFVEVYWYIPPFAFIVGLIAIFAYFKSISGKKFAHRMLLRLPKVKSIFIKIYCEEFASLTGTLFEAGLLPIQVLNLAQRCARNMEIASAIELAAEYFRNGTPFPEALQQSHWLFSDTLYQMLAAGERTGNYGNILKGYSEHLLEQVKNEVERAVGLIEPIMIGVFGLVVMFVVVGFYGGISNAIGNMVK